LLGIARVELGGAPFALANRDSMDVKARELGLRLHRSANVHVLPPKRATSARTTWPRSSPKSLTR
jgi:uncharacterized 2Fe-2S/4Fe-4S cluster protein (DUF4445 family)